ncbi:MAG: DHA2 family efflux MFS transporter permease subunit [Clostridiales bacterium]|nr:DHA2 family efflux MFS transporter permease subunit [Clostridiales bacterium]
MARVQVSSRKRMLIFVNIVISCIASSLLATALSTALLPIATDLNVSVTTGQWLTSGYSLMMAIVMPLSAFLISRFPTKRLYSGAILLFLAGLAVCALAVNFPMMMVGRLMQAAGGGVLTSMAQVIILTIFPEEQKGSAMGWYGLAIGAAPVIAPTLGGILVDTLGWRAIFVCSFVIMLVSFIYSLLVFENVLDNEKKKFDVASFIMSALAFGGITLGIGNIGTYGAASVQFLLPLIVGVVFAAIFSVRQLHLDVPFLDISILKDKDYAISVIGSMLLYFNVYGGTVILPLYVEQALGMSATIAGLITLPGSLVSAIVSPFAGRIYDKVGMRILFIIASILLIISNGMMCFVTLDVGLWVAVILNITRNIATACLLMTLVTWGASTVSINKTSHATALLTSLRTIAGSIGTAVFVAIMTMVSTGAAASVSESSASMRGVNMAFLGMFISDIVLFIIALLGTRDATKKKPKTATA